MAAWTLGSLSPWLYRSVPWQNVSNCDRCSQSGYRRFQWTRRLQATIEKLRITLATRGLPEIVVTDNGSNFVSKEFENFLKQNGIRHIRIAPYHRASNGMAEGAVQTFKEGMKKMNRGSVDTCDSRFLTRYRITRQTSTGVPPAELFLGRKPRARLDLVYPEIWREVRQSQASQKVAHD